MPDPLLLIHGALQDETAFAHLLPHLAGRFDLHTLTFPGHGSRPLGDTAFGIEGFAQAVLDWMESAGLAVVDIFGYSMGGYTGLALARMHPARIRRVFTLGTELVWTPERAERDLKTLDPDRIEARVPHYARALEKIHTALGWRALLAHTADMVVALGHAPLLHEADFRALACPVRLAVGDRDTAAGVAETLEVAGWIPGCEFQVLPNTPHPLDRADAELLAVSIRNFFS